MPHEALLHYDSDKNVSHVKHVNRVLVQTILLCSTQDCIYQQSGLLEHSVILPAVSIISRTIEESYFL